MSLVGLSVVHGCRSQGLTGLPQPFQVDPWAGLRRLATPVPQAGPSAPLCWLVSYEAAPARPRLFEGIENRARSLPRRRVRQPVSHIVCRWATLAGVDDGLQWQFHVDRWADLRRLTTRPGPRAPKVKGSWRPEAVRPSFGRRLRSLATCTREPLGRTPAPKASVREQLSYPRRSLCGGAAVRPVSGAARWCRSIGSRRGLSRPGQRSWQTSKWRRFSVRWSGEQAPLWLVGWLVGRSVGRSVGGPRVPQ